MEVQPQLPKLLNGGLTTITKIVEWRFNHINPYCWIWNLSLSKVEADENERKIGMSGS